MTNHRRKEHLAAAAERLLESWKSFAELGPELWDELERVRFFDVWVAAGEVAMALEYRDGRSRRGLDPRTADPRQIPAEERV